MHHHFDLSSISELLRPFKAAIEISRLIFPVKLYFGLLEGFLGEKKHFCFDVFRSNGCIVLASLLFMYLITID